jgi:hypothetical protein
VVLAWLALTAAGGWAAPRATAARWSPARTRRPARRAARAARPRRTASRCGSGALILFLAFISLSRVPTTEVKILATALARGIVIDATIVRGVLAPALVAALGDANWCRPTRRRTGR